MACPSKSPNSQIVQITYETRQKGQAALRAQAFAEDYLDYRRSRAEGLVTSQSDQVQRQIVTATEEQAALAARLAELRHRLRRGERGPDPARCRHGAAQPAARAGLRTPPSTPTNPGQVVTPAEVRPRGARGSWIAYPAAGMIGGLLIARGVAVLRARLDNHIHHPDDIAILGHSLSGQGTWAESEQAVSALRGDAGRSPPMATAASGYACSPRSRGDPSSSSSPRAPGQVRGLSPQRRCCSPWPLPASTARLHVEVRPTASRWPQPPPPRVQPTCSPTTATPRQPSSNMCADGSGAAPWTLARQGRHPVR